MFNINSIMNTHINKVFYIIIIFLCSQLGAVYADIDEISHWPVETTYKWNSVYGKVSGISLQNGDSIGIFDNQGKCYGAGLVKGGCYFLSAYFKDDIETGVSGDFAIPGFKKGDEVFFRVFKKSTGEEYELKPESGSPYKINYYAEKDKVIEIDLVYGKEGGSQKDEGTDIEMPESPSSGVEGEDTPVEQPIGTEDIVVGESDENTGITPLSAVGSVWPQEEAADEAVPEETKVEEKAEETAPAGEGEEPVIDNKTALVPVPVEQEYEPTDYYGEGEPAGSVIAPRPRPSAEVVTIPAESVSKKEPIQIALGATGGKEEPKEVKEAVVQKTLPSAKPAVSEAQAAAKESCPFYLILIVIGAVLLMLAFILFVLSKKSDKEHVK